MATSTFVDFKMVKQAVSILQVLDRYGITANMKRQHDRLSGCCPVCQSDNQTSFRVSISRNIWNCFSGCSGGNILDLVSQLEEVSIREAALLIQEWFNLDTRAMTHGEKKAADSEPAPNGAASSDENATRTEPQCEPTAGNADSIVLEPVNPPLTFSLQSLDVDHAYLKERGLTARTIEEFGLGYCAKGIMRGRIAIPVHNVRGELVAYAGRLVEETTSENPKYRLPKGFEKAAELFNLHRAIEAIRQEPVIIVEGFFDCMKVWQAGIRNVIALMGCSLSQLQESLLCQALGEHNRVHLLLDQDEAGIEARKRLAGILALNHYVRILELPSSGVGPDDCSERELREILL